MFDLRIGTVLRANEAAAMIPKLMPYGFESYEITFGGSTAGFALKEMGRETLDSLGDSGIVISSLGVYGNPLLSDPGHADTLASLERVIDNARYFHCDTISAFAGRIPGCPADQSIPKFKEVFTPLAKRAADQGVRIAFENCPMGGNWKNGDWNIAFNAELWEMMFTAVPMDNLGLEWEPAHQMCALTDPIPQLRKWADKVFHVHGKDATIAWDVLREKGLNGSARFAWDRTPGFGDINWNDIVTILRMHQYRGTIDIEGYHDIVYNSKELEWPSQVRSLKYLKECRGGIDWVDMS
jgi:sugar phosphate isomerase/epimerase